MKNRCFVRIAHSVNCACPDNPGKTRIPTEVFEKAPSLKTIGIYSYMLTYPKGELFTLGRLAYSSADGVDSVNSGIEDLLLIGWIQEVRLSPKSGWVYLLQSLETITPRYKIGKSEDPWQRFYEVQSMSPVPLKLLTLIRTSDMGQLETQLHRKYQAKRLYFNGRRGEWFALSDVEVQEIKLTGVQDAI